MLLARPGVPHPDTPEFQPPAPAYDVYRTLRFAAFGVAIGPLVGVWMKFLERRIPLKIPGGNTGVQTAKRVFMDQVVL
jgi:protein Mpv17